MSAALDRIEKEFSDAPLIPDYTAEPTPAKFHNSKAFVRALMGPIGSGKSVAGFLEIFRIASIQKPQYDGIRRSRHAVIRNTYPELRTTSLKTFEDWFGNVAAINYGTPISAVIKVNDIEAEVYFLSLDKPKDIKKLLSLELTTVFINECKEVPKSALEMSTGRVGRYPAKKDGGQVQSCVFMDTNPPDDDHWFYELFEENRPDGYALFKQPPALLKVETKNGNVYLPNPDCENVRNQSLGYDYWMRQIPGKTDEWIKVYVLGQYGSSQDGRPCYPTYKDNVHCSPVPLTPVAHLPLLMGFDFGRTPASVIGQLLPNGRLIVVDELIVDAMGNGMGLRRFLQTVVRPHLFKHYAAFTSIYVQGDPSGAAKQQGDDDSMFDILGEEGFHAEPSSTNDIDPRLECVEYFLNLSIEDGPGLLIDPRCKVLRKGFLGGYQFERLQVSGETRFRDKPKKNQYSHPHDALQYLCDLAKYKMIGGGRVRARPVVTTGAPSAMGWT